MGAASAILRFALCLAALDSVMLIASGEPLRVVAAALPIAAGVWLLLASCAALSLWTLAAVTSHRKPPAGDAAAPTLDALLWQPGDGQAGRVAGLLAAVVLVAVLALPTFALARVAIDSMVQPHFTAITVMGIHAVSLGVAALLMPRTRALCLPLLVRAQRVPLLGPALGTLGRTLLCLAAFAVVLAGAVVLVSWQVFSLMPWGTLLPPAGAVVLAALWGWACARGLPLWPRGRVGSAVAGVAAVALLAVLGYASTIDSRAANALARTTVGGGLGYAALSPLLDFDGDGHLGLLGGGDCAPHDRRRHPGAVERPDNGVDEDCSGADLAGFGPAAPHRVDYPLPATAERRPPIFLLTVDAFAAYRMKAFGGKRDLTPNLDRLMKESAVFEHCFSQGPSTRLSFPSIFLSRHDTVLERELLGKRPYPIAEKELTLAELMKQAGYATRAVVPIKYFLAHQWPGLTQGFDSVLYRSGSSPTKSGMVSDTALKDLRKYVKTHRGQALFAWLHYFDTHSPHEQPESFPVLGPDKIDIYDAELQLVDREMGRVLKWIDEEYGKRAVIVVTGDHGAAFDTPRHKRHNYGHDLYSATLHVPMIIRAPWVKPGRYSRLVSTMDVLPTLVNLVGLSPEVRFDGHSLIPDIRGKEVPRPSELVHQFYLAERLRVDDDPLAHISLRTDRHHLIHNREKGHHELYDWKSDFFETRDLSKERQHRALLAQLVQKLSAETTRLHRKHLTKKKSKKKKKKKKRKKKSKKKKSKKKPKAKKDAAPAGSAEPDEATPG